MIGEGKVGDVTLLEVEGRHSGDLGMAPQKRRGIAGEHRQAQPQAKFCVGVAETPEQPLAEKAGAPGEEQAFAAQLFQFRRGVAEDVGEVAGGKREKMVLRFAHKAPAWLILELLSKVDTGRAGRSLALSARSRVRSIAKAT